MSSPIKGQTSKRPLSEMSEKENLISLTNSPQKPSPSPKKGRTVLAPSINGLPVEKQVQSPSKLAPRRLIELFEESEPSHAKHDLIPAHFQAELAIAEDIEPIQIFKKILPAPTNWNITHLLAQREERLAPLRFNVNYWNEQATRQETASEILRCMSLAVAGANHNPKEQKKLLESLAIKQLASEKYNDTLATCDQIDRFFPEDFMSVLLIRGFCHLKLKNYENCCKYYRDAIEKSETLSSEEDENNTPTEWESHSNLISISIVALKAAKKSEQASRDLTLDFLELIYLLQCTNNQLDEAITTLEEQEELLPGSTMIEQGFCYCNLNLPEEGIEMFRSALETQSGIFLKPDPFIFLIAAARELKDQARSLNETDLLHLAVGYCNWALLQQKDRNEQEEALILKYECETILKHYPQALATVQSIEALVPKKPYYLIFQALCHFKLHQPEEATELLKKALESKSSITQIDVNTLSVCSHELFVTGQRSLSKSYVDWAQESLASNSGLPI